MSDFDFTNAGFFEGSGMNSFDTGGIFDVTLRREPTDRSADEDW